jgi:hypothetical protein
MNTSATVITLRASAVQSDTDHPLSAVERVQLLIYDDNNFCNLDGFQEPASKEKMASQFVLKCSSSII